MKKYAIIVAGGSGTRMKSEVPKQFLPLHGRPVLAHTLAAFKAAGDLEIILVLPPSQIRSWQDIVSENGISVAHQVVAGGETRFHSVKNGLEKVPDNGSLVAVHDGVRPLVTPLLINRCFEEAMIFGSAVAAVPLKDSLRRAGHDARAEPLDRDAFRLVQTPQAFKTAWMKKAFDSAYHPFFTDCASVVEYAGFAIHLTNGDYRNLKITTPEDLLVAAAFLSSPK